MYIDKIRVIKELRPQRNVKSLWDLYIKFTQLCVPVTQ